MKDLNEMTSAEMLAWKGKQDWTNAEPGVEDQLDAIIMQRSVDEKVDVAMHKVEQRNASASNDAKAVRDWPELKDKESHMYKGVLAELEKDPDSKDDPTAFRDAANRVGLEMGLLPEGFQPARSDGDPMGAIGGGEGAPVDKNDDTGEQFLKDTEKVAEAFSELIDLKDDKVRARIAARAEGEVVDNG